MEYEINIDMEKAESIKQANARVALASVDVPERIILKVIGMVSADNDMWCPGPETLIGMLTRVCHSEGIAWGLDAKGKFWSRAITEST